MTEPRTTSGKRLLNDLDWKESGVLQDCAGFWRAAKRTALQQVTDALPLIEAEARADALREVGERLAALQVHEFETPSGIGDERYFPDMLDRAEVLNAFKTQPPAPDPT